MQKACRQGIIIDFQLAKQIASREAVPSASPHITHMVVTLGTFQMQRSGDKAEPRDGKRPARKRGVLSGPAAVRMGTNRAQEHIRQL